MKTLLSLSLLLTFPLAAAAQAPRMTVRQENGTIQLLQIERADVSVTFLGDVAETEFLLNFRNDSDRAEEGEFVLPLPEGATVSGYALEVNGKLREGVAVEKERARDAYETVKRRMVDPGIVEREAGNVYRTKVYPVPANGTKQLRIRYNEILPHDGKDVVYSLPLDFAEPLNTFTCRLHGDALDMKQITHAAGLEFTKSDDGSLKAEQKDSKIGGTLKLTFKESTDTSVIVDNNENPAFYLRDRAPNSAPRPRPIPGKVMLVWDASASGRDRDHEKEYKLLDQWFAKIDNTRVSLRLLRDRMTDAGEFEIRHGNWQNLKAALQVVHYDGATDLSAMRVPDGVADLVVHAGDGLGTLGTTASSVIPPLVFIRSGAVDRTSIGGTSAQYPDSSVIDLTNESMESAMRKLTEQPLELLAIKDGNITRQVTEKEIHPGQTVRIFGTMKKQQAGSIELVYGYGKEPTTTRKVDYQPAKTNGDTRVIGRLEAQRVLANLEQQERPDRQRIIAHCQKHGLVSDFTSLIVLEELQDYVVHCIRPPEPELQKEYNKLLAEWMKRNRPREIAWDEKLEWFRTKFPGYEAIILPRLKQVAVWKKAVESQFEPARRDAAAFGSIVSWHDKAMETIRNKNNLKTAEDYQSWVKAIDSLHKQGPELFKTPLHPPPPGKPLAVSVRGLVTNPGVITSDAPMTLKQAIIKGGGFHPLGSPDNVTLYRNAGRIVYNTLSEKFEDIPLFPGDMVVIGRTYRTNDPACDPFADFSTPADPRKDEAIREQGDPYEVLPPEPTTGGKENAGGVKHLQASADTASPAPESIRTILTSEIKIPDLKNFTKAINSGKDPETEYRKLTANSDYPQGFYIEVSRILFANKHTDLARRVLSNIVEMRPGDIAALRAYAYWLADAGLVKDAGDALRTADTIDPSAELLTLDRFSLAMTSESDGADVGSSNWKSRDLAAIVATDMSTGAKPNFLLSNLPSDIRIVIFSSEANVQLDFSVQSPGDFLCGTSFSRTDPCGGRIIGSNGVLEYMCRNAVPGTYKILCTSARPTTVRAVIH
ncbi:MAG: VIT domain-containing protein, partial [Verrucomicrobiota bacterium]